MNFQAAQTHTRPQPILMKFPKECFFFANEYKNNLKSMNWTTDAGCRPLSHLRDRSIQEVVHISRPAKNHACTKVRASITVGVERAEKTSCRGL